MDWIIIALGTVFFFVGTLIVLYIRRFAKWWAGFAFKNKLTYSAYKHQELTKEEYIHKRTNTWPNRGFWLLWLLLINILGIMLALTGVFMILQSIFDN